MDNSMPAVERAVAVLEALAGAPGGATVAQLAAATGVPRATLYRMLRVFSAHAFVARSAEGYVLGPGLRRLAASVPARDLPRIAQPVMDRLCARIGESVKLVVRNGTEALTIAAAHSGNDSRIAVRIGMRLPLYVGASQRLLLSRAPADVVDAVLAAPRRRHASGTIVAERALRSDVARLRGERCAIGASEGVEGVGAVAACVDDASGATVAALVSVYIQPGKGPARLRAIREATLAAADELSRQLAAG
jgi:DNA-binding IclR family transcriptional regulator